MQPKKTLQERARIPAPKHNRELKTVECLKDMGLELYPYPASLSKLFSPWALSFLIWEMGRVPSHCQN